MTDEKTSIAHIETLNMHLGCHRKEVPRILRMNYTQNTLRYA